MGVFRVFLGKRPIFIGTKFEFAYLCRQLIIRYTEMKRILLFALALMLLLATFAGCQKTDADVLGIIGTEEVENYFGTTVKVFYSNSTKMYFHLLSDTTAEVVNHNWFYSEEGESSPWVYRGDVVVPNRFVHNGKTYKVTCIGEGTFSASVHNNELVSLVSSVELPNTIDTIRDGAFCECMHMTSIDIPNSVRYIGDDAFAASGLASVVIPSSVKGFGNGVFSSTCLSRVEIPESMEKIPFYMFSKCFSLASVTLHDHITCIGDGAFESTGFTSFEIPASVKYLGVNPLDNCTSLTTLICHPITPPEKDPDGLQFEDYFMLNNAIERILVPAQSVELYKESHFWRGYKDIIVGM